MIGPVIAWDNFSVQTIVIVIATPHIKPANNEGNTISGFKDGEFFLEKTLVSKNWILLEMNFNVQEFLTYLQMA